jgi:Endoglucanase
MPLLLASSALAPRARRFSAGALFATICALLLPLSAGPAARASEEGFYSPVHTYFPREGTGEGTPSAYAGATPRVEKAPDGREILRLPSTGRNEVNLLWTFWGHHRPSADQWPSGSGTRASLTIASESAVTLQSRLYVKTGGWSEPVPGPALALSPGQPATLEIPLPSSLPPGAVEQLRVLFSASPSVPPLTITGISVGNLVPVAVYPETHDPANPAAPVAIAGRASPGADVVVQARAADSSRTIKEWRVTAGAADGRFSFQIDPASLPAGPLTLRAATRPAAGGETLFSADASLYLYPIIDRAKTLPLVHREGRQLLVDGKPWAFAGLNYTRFLLEFSLPGRASFQTVAEDLRRYGDWGVSVLRVPFHLGMFQPRPGVFPDHPDYLEILKSHNLDPRFYELFEYFVAVAGHHGIRVILDWHEMPTDPYRYFVGGNLNQKKEGKPGTGIAWLHDPATGKAAEPGDARHTRAIVDTNRWLARRFKGNGNILGFEVPYNEPHGVTDSSDLAWRKITSDTILPIVSEDPARLTFGMPPAWGHSNVLNSVTWMLPDHITGITPHHYLGNGPVPLRSDAKTRHSPWLARDVAATFDHSMFAAALPNSAAPAPIYNGESGEHGYGSFLPDMDRRAATSLMIEAQLVQTYASGWTGSLGWTLTGHETVYQPVVDLYEAAYRRFAPVYAAGPVDQMNADILFVQNTAAVPINNGLNHACVPFARLALDLHLTPVHYMTDDQLLGTGLVQMAVGLEQVEQIATGLRYKAAVVDTRNLDSRALDLLRGSKLPLLVVDDAAKLTAPELAAFLKKAGVALDEKTPAELQLVEGPSHLLVYRRSGEGAARAWPRLDRAGPFELIDEQDRVVFSGTAAALAEKGVPVDLPRWRTAIFRIRARG